MNQDVLVKLKELYDLIDVKLYKTTDCIISGDHPNEANVIATREGYLYMIKIISELLLVDANMIISNEYDSDEDGLSSSEIKKSINEYSDFWIVACVLQNYEQFEDTIKLQYDKFSSENKGG